MKESEKPWGKSQQNRALRRKMPTKEVLWKYWSDHREQLGPNRDYSNEFEDDKISCFACGNIKNIERCHIVPMLFGGDHDPQNLHLLCGRCHLESEGLRLYWPWLRNKRRREYKHYTEHLQDLLDKCEVDVDEIVRDVCSQHEFDESKKDMIMFDIWNTVFWKK